MSSPDIRQMANAIRFLSLDAIERASEGHPGAPLGCAEIATVLFTRHLKCNPKDPEWPDRDRFVLSNGHGSMLLYSLLHLSGYEKITIEEIKRFRELGSHCHGHPEFAPDVGIEVTTGPLGQGIANAVGMAVAEARLSQWFGPGIIDHYTYALVGDGCLMEGVAHEIISLAGHLQLGKLVFFWDDNRITDDGGTDMSISEDVRARFQIAGWQVIDADGHDPDAIDAAITLAKTDPRPSMIACRTIIGKGLARLQGQRGAHGGRVFKEDTDAARRDLDWPHAPFLVPDPIRSAWHDGVSGRNQPVYDAWERRVAALPDEQQRLFKRVMAGRLPEGWQSVLVDYKRRMAELQPTQRTINSSAEISGLLADAIPELLTGAPDLQGPTNHKQHLGAFTAKDHSGRYIHYGIREHAMGSMMNGMAAHGGAVPVGATYLAFSDYERPALRMAALMGLPVISVFSHDSIGIGKNGPTHQPVEILASLRAMPNMLVLRPADSIEAAECWEMALASRGGPSCLVFTHQPVPTVRTRHTDENLSRRGAYVLVEAEGGARRATLLASGSEVAIALAAKVTLEERGIPTAVVSMPCWSAFDEQDESYRHGVLGIGTIRVAVEAAVRLGWDRYIGENGAFVGMSSFGASGPSGELFRHFGITPEAVVAEVLRRL
ncbi:transketolase [Telmatospirillum sp.]|uniref:transketolase n=1 Tax=Telmatospirillum sp. TaxID=2079197 RepID=UPI00283D1A0D|nr:transketolase [Telmatospirillum sp.]MDR3439768.1 transketolase [Telmatospirillum sp.]